MNEESLNMQIRKFLKKVGIQSQREIENAVRAGIDSGQISTGDELEANMKLEIEALNLSFTINDGIKIEP